MESHSVFDSDEQLENAIERFEAAHRQGDRPAIDDFLAAAITPGSRGRWLVELIHADLECRLAAGDAVQAEQYFARYPEIAGDEEAAVGIIVAEFELRSEHDANVCWDEYFARYSQYAERLVEHATVGRFRLLCRPGEGNFGVVWKAEDTQLERIVALKILHPGRLGTRTDVERFLREGRSVARLHHPGIVAVHEVGTHDGVPFLVSEFVTGQSLAAVLKMSRPGVRESAEIIAQVAEALDYAHSLGVVHRDIKPSNIMLAEPALATNGRSVTANRPRAKVTDFGLARRIDVDRTLTRAGEILGTPAYMAPEQALGEVQSIDARSDVYSLGVVLYQLLAGKLPFHGNASQIMQQLLHDDPPPIRAADRSVPRDLEAVCLKCLEKSRERRYSTAGALAEDLRRWLRNEPTQARPVGLVRRAAQWARRRPAIAALWLVSLLAVVGVTGTNLWRLNQLGQALEQSETLRVVAQRERTNTVQAKNTARRLLYASRMRNAQQAWRDGNIRQMRTIIDYYADGTPEAALRHFEWFHLNHLANLPHRILRGHTDKVYAVAYSPDGKLLLSGGRDGTLRLWNAESGQEVAVLQEHESCVDTIDFAADGDTFATASCDKTIKVWSLNQRKPFATLLGHAHPIDICKLIDEDRLLVSLSSEANGRREVRMWNVASGTMRTDWPPADEPIRAFAAAETGNTLVTLTGGQAKVWKRGGDAWVASHSFKLSVPTPSGGLLLSPDEQFILIPVWPRDLHIIRLRDGARVNILAGGGTAISFSASGDRLATTLGDTICVFQFPTGQLEHRLVGHEWGPLFVAWSPFSGQLAVSGNDRTVRIWDLQRATSRLHLKLDLDQVPPVEAVWDLAYLKEGKHVNVVYEGRSFVWNIKTGRSVSPMHLAGPRLDIAEGNTRDAPFANDCYALLPQWDPVACYIPPRIHYGMPAVPTGTIRCTQIMQNGQHIVEIRDGKLRTWNLNPLQPVEEHPIDSLNPPDVALAISPDGKWLCGARVNGTIELRNLSDWSTVEFASCTPAPFARFSQNGDRVALYGFPLPKCSEYDAYTGKHIRDYDVTLARALSYSADGQRLAIAFESGDVVIYDVVTGEETLRLDVVASALQFASDGASLLTNGAPDGGFYLWPGKTDFTN